MANEFTLSTPAGEPATRSLMMCFLNTGAKEAPVWSVLGTRVEESSVEFDYQMESKTDVLDQTRTTARKPIRTQSFEPCEVDSADSAQAKLIQLAIVEDNVQALLNLDMLIVHAYLKNSTGKVFAERFDACSILPESLGGAGGAALGMPINVTYGGERITGTATVTGTTVTFVAANAA